MLDRKLKWSHLKGLYELYERGQTSARIQDNAFIKYLKNSRRLIGCKLGSQSVLVANTGYKEYYRENLFEAFNKYSTFLESNNISLDGRQQFDEYDLEAFSFIVERREEILSSVPSIRQFSSMVFRKKGSKYLDTHPGIASIVLRLLRLEEFPGRDPKENQWRFVVDHPAPEIIVLCENIANLKRPWIARANNIELWYVGGNNTAILEHISEDKLKLPLVYCCDWDQHGIDIYHRIYKIFSDKNKEVMILTPYSQTSALPEDSPNHNSRWKENDIISRWPTHPFNSDQVVLLSKLFSLKQWIEEESQDLLELLYFNGYLKRNH